MGKKQIKIKDFANVELDGQPAGSVIDVIRNYSGDLVEIQAALNVFEGSYNLAREQAVKDAQDTRDAAHQTAIAQLTADRDTERTQMTEAITRLTRERDAATAERNAFAGSDLPAARKQLKKLERQALQAQIEAHTQKLAQLGPDAE